MDMRMNLMPTVGDHHSWKRKRRILEGVVVTVTAVEVWFNNSHIEKALWEHYLLLREQIRNTFVLRK